MTATAMRLDGFYDDRYRGEYMAKHAAIDRAKVADFLAAVPAADSSRVLDYGCGQGAWIALLQQVFPRASLTGTDISTAGLQKAVARMPAARFVPVTELRRELAAAGRFDVVFSYHVLEHVADIDATLALLAECVRPGGLLLLILPCANAWSLEECLVRAVRDGCAPGPTGERRFFFEEPGHLRRLTTTEVLAPLQRRGLRRVRCWYANHFFGSIQWLCAAGPGFVHDIYKRPGTSPVATAWLQLAGAVLAVLSRLVIRHRSAAARAGQRGGRTLILDAVAAVFARLLDGAAWLEWRLLRWLPNGSEQFLCLRRDMVAESRQ